MQISSIKQRFRFCILVCLVLLTKTISGTTVSAKKIVYDSSAIIIRTIPEEKKEAILTSKDYKYGRDLQASPSLWDQFVQWIQRAFRRMLNSKGGEIGFQIIEYGLMALAICLIIFLLLKNNFRAIFYGKSADVPVVFSSFKENIHAVNFEVLIKEALEKKDYRKAIRLNFLQLLKELSNKNLITWQADKTNNDYLLELSKSNVYDAFKETAFLYEYVWYGDFQISESTYSSMVSKFNNFKLP